MIPKGNGKVKHKVLICDDTEAVHSSLTSYLKAAGIEVYSAYTGEEALEYLNSMNADIAILDVMLPGISGLDVCREIRKNNTDIYIIMLSAMGEELDRIVGLEVGADDYVVKPFSPRELTVKIRKILERLHSKEKITKLEFGELVIFPESYEVFIKGSAVDLTPREVEVLTFLARNAGRVQSRESILESVWGYEFYGDERNVDSLIKRLRQKLGSHPGFQIRSIYGVGYKFEADNER